MSLPTVVCRIAFATAPFAATPTWADVSGDVLRFTMKRGRQHELDRIEAGRATITLLNSSGDYWPRNAAGPYYGNLIPGKRINLRATYDAVTYDLFTGFIVAYDYGFLGGVLQGPIVTLTCVDLFNALAQYKLNDGAGYAEERSDVRVGNVLDDLGWPTAGRTLSVGQSTIQASGALSNVAALTHLRSVEQSEAGLLFIGPDGKVVFQDRHDRFASPYTTSQATYGDDPGELPYDAVTFVDDDQHIYNDVRLARTGGSAQAVSDATSQTTYGVRTLQRTGLLQTTDGEVLDQANYHLARYKDAALRVKTLTIKPERQPADEWPDALGFDIGTRITVRLDDASVDEDYHIEGIEHRATATPKEWQTTWQLSLADAQQYWSLGYGKLGETTRIAY